VYHQSPAARKVQPGFFIVLSDQGWQA